MREHALTHASPNKPEAPPPLPFDDLQSCTAARLGFLAPGKADDDDGHCTLTPPDLLGLVDW
jgi:hypothetical protein